MRCNDCGNPITERPVGRQDICNPCLELRETLIAALQEGKVSMDEFREIQREMQRSTGKAAAAAMRVLNLTHETND